MDEGERKRGGGRRGEDRSQWELRDSGFGGGRREGGGDGRRRRRRREGRGVNVHGSKSTAGLFVCFPPILQLQDSSS